MESAWEAKKGVRALLSKGGWLRISPTGLQDTGGINRETTHCHQISPIRANVTQYENTQKTLYLSRHKSFYPNFSNRFFRAVLGSQPS